MTQARLLRRIHRTRPGPARQRLIAQLIELGDWAPQIRALAGRWMQEGTSLEELVQAGYLGLLEAIARWRPGRRGWRTYAYFWIRKSLERTVRVQGPIVLETEHEIRLSKVVAKVQLRGAKEPAEIAERTGLSLPQVCRALGGRRSRCWAPVEEHAGGEVCQAQPEARCGDEARLAEIAQVGKMLRRQGLPKDEVKQRVLALLRAAEGDDT